MSTANHTSKAAEDVDAFEFPDCHVHGRLKLVCIRDVDLDWKNRGTGKRVLELIDLCFGVGWIDVEEC